MKRIKYFYLAIFSFTLLIFIAGCKKTNSNSSSLYTPTSADVTANATLTELQQGRTLYIKNCNSCHPLFSPDDYVPMQWKSILNIMTPKTSMSAAEVMLVTKYVCRGKQ